MDLEQISQILGDKWQIKIIYYCGSEGMSFNELQEKLKISRSVLTRKLNKLLSLNILNKKNFATNFEKRCVYLISKRGTTFHKKISEFMMED